MQEPLARSLPDAAVVTSEFPAQAFAQADPLPDPARFETDILAIDRRILALRAARERVILPLARAAATFVGRRAWRPLGFARLEDFGRERFRRSGRWLGDLAALGRALPRLRGLKAALTGDDGGPPIGQAAAVLVARAASPASTRTWIAAARAMPLRALREAAAAAREAGSEWPGEDLSRRAVADPSEADSREEPTDLPALEPQPEDYDRATLRLPLPRSVRAAFDEALDLHRAVEGREASVASFVEALCAEAASGGTVPDHALDPVLRRPTRAEREQALTVAGRGGSDLPAIEQLSEAGTDAHLAELAADAERKRGPQWRAAGCDANASDPLLRRLAALESCAGEGRAAELEQQLLDLLYLEEEIDQRLGELLLDLTERRAWPRLGFLDVGHYAEERLGISRSVAETRVRLARATRRHWHLKWAYQGAFVGQQSALLVARVLGRTRGDSLPEWQWVQEAMSTTVKRLRDDLRCALRRDCDASTGASAKTLTISSDDPGDLSRSAEAGETSSFASGLPLTISSEHPRNMVPPPPTDAEWQASLRRYPGMARERVRDLAERALASPIEDDVLRLTLPEDVAHGFLATIEARRRALESAGLRLGAGPEAPETSEPSERRPRAPLPGWVALLTLIDEFVETWDDPRLVPKRPGDPTYQRDGYRCAAPGCTSRQGLEEHHVVYRSHGGSDAESNRVTICGFHHKQGEHGGQMRVTGEAPLGLLWGLGTPDTPELFRNERRLASRSRFAQIAPGA